MMKCELQENNITCKICGCETKYRKKFFFRHLKGHNISFKEYYDKFYKDEDDLCVVCKREPPFYTTSYKKLCSEECEKLFRKNMSKFCPDFAENVSKSKQRMDHDSANKKRKETCLQKYGVESVRQLKEIQEKADKTCLERYGEVQNFKNPKYKELANIAYAEKYDDIMERKKQYWSNENIQSALEKRRKTCLERYGVESVLQLASTWDIIRANKEADGKWVPLSEQEPFRRYRLDVERETRKWIDELFEKWDGLCYYTKKPILTTEQFLKVNPDKTFREYLDKASVDHKITVYYGYTHGMTVEEIGNISNLCICSFRVNCSKTYKNEDDFLQEMEKWK